MLLTKFIIYLHIDNVLGLYLDLQKAFDSIDHDLLFMLHNYGIKGKTLDWFKNYLSNSSQ